MKKISKRNVLCVLMTVMLVMSSLAPGIAMGAEQDGTYDSIGTIFQSDHMEMKITLDGDDLLPDNEELFSGYVQQRFDREIYGDISLFGLSAGDRLPEGSLERNVYEILKEDIKKVADGKRESLIFDVDTGLKSLSWSIEELGLSGGTYTEKELQQAILNKLQLSGTFDFSKVFYCLLTDCPYELYWFDKTKGAIYAFNKYDFNNNTASITNLVFGFYPAEAYKGSEDFTVDITKTGAASNAVKNAQTIVSQNENLTDVDKLTAYKDAICDAVSYDFDSADESNNTLYGDPWQIIYVFDGNEETNVVCEGYSKAFKYLCDLSEFDGEVNCFLAVGVCGGDHMWNVLEYNERNYLVDVTNCDEDTVGAPDKLFLVGTQGTNNNRNHKFTLSINGSPRAIEYIYDESEEDLHCDGYPALTPGRLQEIPESVINAVTGYSDVYDGQNHDAVVIGSEASGYNISFSNEKDGEYSDVNPTVKNVSDSRAVWVEISKDGYETIKKPVNVSISKKTLTIDGAVISDKEYDGQGNIPLSNVTMVTLNGDEDELTLGTDFEVISAQIKGTDYYAGVKQADITVSLNSTEKTGNYSLPNGTYTGTVNIVAAPQTISSIYTSVDNAYELVVGGDSVDLSNLASSDVEGKELSFNISEGAEYASLNGTALTPTKAPGTVKIIASAGEYNAGGSDEPEYQAAEDVTIYVKVVSKMDLSSFIDISGITGLDKTYDGKAADRKGNAVIDKAEYKVLENSLVYEYVGVDGTAYDKSDIAPSDAGTYKLMVSIPTDNKKYKGSAEKKFEISKATIEVKAKNKSVYVNGAVPDLTNPVINEDYTVTGLIGEDQLVGTAVMLYEKDGKTVTPDSKAEAKYDIVISGLSAPAGGNYNEVTPINGVLSIVKKQEALPGAALPPMPLPAAQEPTIQAGEGAKVTLNSDGTTAKITLSDDYELADVTLNGVSKGKITEISGLKTGDKLVVITAKKAVESEEQKLEEIISMLKSRHLKARSRLTVLKNGKKAVCITWSEENGEDMNFDGVQIFRSVKKNSGYGKKPIYVSKSDRYYNTGVKKGTKYYYKVRGFIEFNGKKYYTDYSTKAIRTVK